ncbi:hypothetical protein [Nakamurella leprariae]|uniref:hypothetical protein n=1 Tax=Nakamurella leprariae TaxID=2803911 RepID=UPI001966B700|nr:hypothetical protein [Nakamurella leprariae]
MKDEATAETFAPDGHAIERLPCGSSLTICLPDGLSHRSSAGTGTVMRPETLRRSAFEAGFGSADILPTGEFGFWRFYRLSG